jgi:hypothetical protein
VEEKSDSFAFRMIDCRVQPSAWGWKIIPQPSASLNTEPSQDDDPDLTECRCPLILPARLVLCLAIFFVKNVPAKQNLSGDHA